MLLSLDRFRKFISLLGRRGNRVEDLQEVERPASQDHSDWVLHRPKSLLKLPPNVDGCAIGAVPKNDLELVERIIAAYQRTAGKPSTTAGSMWSHFENENEHIHLALLEGDATAVAEILRHPIRNRLLRGFDSLNSDDAELHGEPWWPMWLAMMSYDALLCVAEAIGILASPNGETWGPTGPTQESNTSPEQVLDSIERELDCDLEFPNPFAGELGLATSKGVINYRAVQALFQAYRVTQLTDGRAGGGIAEIGAGLGRTAFFATRMGATDYTIVDLPLVNVAQAYYLGRILGENAITLHGEQPLPGTVRITPSHEFLENNASFDLVLNVDSLTEMPEQIASRFLQHATANSRALLSINHEANAFTVRQLIRKQTPVRSWSRNPYWLRRGYVEEVVILR